MELYDRILQSENPYPLAYQYKSILKQEQKLLHKTMTGILMTMSYGMVSYEKELSDLEEKLAKIDACLAITHK